MMKLIYIISTVKITEHHHVLTTLHTHTHTHTDTEAMNKNQKIEK